MVDSKAIVRLATYAKGGAKKRRMMLANRRAYQSIFRCFRAGDHGAMTTGELMTRLLSRAAKMPADGPPPTWRLLASLAKIRLARS
jgi:hypothetical protein